MRCLIACLFAVPVVVVLPSAGCSHRSRKQERTLKITTTALPDGYDGQKGYSATLTATGGTGSYTWSIISGSLPQNLVLDPSTGVISGDIISNASANSPYTFTIQVTDGQQSVSRQFSLTVNPPPTLTITTTTLPDATEGVTYSYTLTAGGGNAANYNWSISGQPLWLAIDAATGELSGTPPAGSAGTYTFTVEVTDGQQTASKQFDLVVNKPTPPKADFAASPMYGTAPLTVDFTDKSAGAITQWQWDFDNDGTPDSNDQNPTWTYSSPGWYTVKLTVTGPAGSDTCVKESFILVANKIWYVNGNGGDDANGGTDWSDAFATIGKALSVADDYDLILVADATYNETDLNFSGKKIYLKGVDHNTTGARPLIDCQQAGRAFYFDSGETKDSVIDNFTIMNGECDSGGAVYCDSSGPMFNDCVFMGHSSSTSGGAIYCNSGGLTLANCTFVGNNAKSGGAIYCGSSSSVTLTNCSFVGNSAIVEGGAIYCRQNSSLVLTDCTFSDNSAWNGGTIYCCNNSTATLTNCTFSSNAAWNDCGVIFCDSSNLTMSGCEFSGNSAPRFGGAIYCHSCSIVTMCDCIFSGNSAYEGGAIYCLASDPTITNCLFTHNSATGGQYSCGGAICCAFSKPNITNCTFSRNSTDDTGGAIYCFDNCVATLNNSIFWDNSAAKSGKEIFMDATSSCTLNFCCVDNKGYGGSGSIDDTNNCFHADPQFVDPKNGDFHLQSTSPCIDAGDNRLVPSGVDKDLDGNQRVVDGNNDGKAVVDIGVYEFQP